MIPIKIQVCKYCGKEFIVKNLLKQYHDECNRIVRTKRDSEAFRTRYNSDPEFKKRRAEYYKQRYKLMTPEQKKKLFDYNKKYQRKRYKKFDKSNKIKQEIIKTRNKEYKKLSDKEKQKVLYDSFLEMLNETRETGKYDKTRK